MLAQNLHILALWCGVPLQCNERERRPAGCCWDMRGNTELCSDDSSSSPAACLMSLRQTPTCIQHRQYTVKANHEHKRSRSKSPTQYIHLFWQPEYWKSKLSFIKALPLICALKILHRIFPTIILISLCDRRESGFKNQAVTGTKSKILSGSANSFHNTTRKITYKHSVPGGTNYLWAISWPSAAFHNGFHFIVTLWEKTVDIDWFPLVRRRHLKQLQDTKVQEMHQDDPAVWAFLIKVNLNIEKRTSNCRSEVSFLLTIKYILNYKNYKWKQACTSKQITKKLGGRQTSFEMASPSRCHHWMKWRGKRH